MKISSIAKRYAKATFIILKQKGQEEQGLKQMLFLKSVFTPEVVSFYSNPLVSNEQKFQVSKKAFESKGLLEEVYNLLLLLTEKGRMGIALEIVEAFQQKVDEEAGITRGVVKSARQLSKEMITSIEGKINKVVGKKIVLKYEEDPKLLGGMVASVGGWTFDDSIDSHLKKLEEQLNRSFS